ncbi:MAG: hypothetical protein CMJ64_08195 [Planctomycetaceae bacterium]|nr:hypothetical protein [Planctomycetaceae bacterium]
MLATCKELISNQFEAAFCTLKRGDIEHTLHHVEDGVHAMQFLRRQEPYFDVPRPDVVLLDLNMPRKDGHEVLEEIRSDVHLRRVPVMVLTTSEAAEDIDRAYDRATNCYVTKPVDLGGFIELMQALSRFTLDWAELPSAEGRQ